MREQFYDQNKSELRQGRPDTWYDPIKSFFGTLPEWDTTLPGTPDDAAYHLSELRKDMTPGEGQLRSGVRSTQEYNRMMGLLDEGDYPEAAAAGIWSGIEAADVGLSAYGLGILATPFDLARRFKSLTPVRPVPKKIHGGDGAYIGADKKEMTGSFTEGRVNVEDGIKFGVGKPTTSVMDEKAAGKKVKVNLFRQKAGWKWVGEPPVDTPTIISVEQGNKHFYTLDSDIGNVDLAKYPNQKSEPRLRPSSRGDLEFGEEVGKINLRGKEHPVYDSIKVVPKKTTGLDSPGLGGGLLGTVERLSPRKYRTADEFIDAQRKSDYRGTHTAPLRSEGGEGAPLHDISQMYPDDIYGPHAVRYYGDGSPMDTKSVRIIQQFRGKPEAELTIYRAVPNDSKITKIHPGDWVTINEDYAKLHGRGWESKILSKKVKAKEIFTEANSVHEYGYNPSEGGILSNKELGEIWKNAQK